MKKSIILSLTCIFTFHSDILAQNFWTQTNGPFGGSLQKMIVDSSGNIYCGTDGGGVYRSTDNANTWTRLWPQASTVYSLAINQNGHLFAGADSAFRSTDNGNTWSYVGMRNMSVYDIAFLSNQFAFAAAGGGMYQSTDNGQSWTVNTNWNPGQNPYRLAVSSTDIIFAGVLDVGVRRSTDYGASWEYVNNGLSNLYVQVLFMNSNGDLYAGTHGGAGVYRSTNNGDSWTPLGPSLADVRTIVVTQSGIIFAGAANNGIYRSTNDGGTWTSAGLSTQFVISLAAPNNENIIAGTLDRGAFRSTDQGTTWEEANIGLTSCSVNSFIFDDDGFMFAGSNDIAGGENVGSGVFRTANDGGLWSRVGSGTVTPFVTSLGRDLDGYIYAGTRHNGIFRSTDNGATWTSLTLNEGVRCISVDSSNKIYAGTTGSGIYTSTNNGTSWVHLSLFPNTEVRSIVHLSGNIIFAGTNGMGVYRSTNGGTGWAPRNNGLTSLSINTIALSSNNKLYVGTNNGVFRSTDSSQTWTRTSVGLISSYIHSLAVSPGDHIFAGTNTSGVFRSTNEGLLWEPLNDGLTTRTIYSLYLDSFGILWAGTRGGGAFRSIQSTVDVNQFTVALGWNVVSVPLSVNNPIRKSLFPTAISSAFAYEPSSGYVAQDTLQNKKGYWLKFPSAQIISINGLNRDRDTVQVTAGWNFIGTIAHAVDTSGVEQIPPGILSSPFYEFSGQYGVADTLQPGKGYWIKANNPGALIISTPANRQGGAAHLEEK